MTNAKRIEAAAQRIKAQALEGDPQTNEEVLAAVIKVVYPDLQFQTIVKNWVALGIYEWDDMDMQAEDIAKQMEAYGLKKISVDDHYLVFDYNDTHFVYWAPNMGVVTVGSN